MAQAAHEPPAILVEADPKWTFDRGFFKVHWNGQSWAYPPAQFFRMLAGMAEVARQYRFGDGEVITFPTKVRGEH